LRFKQLFYQVYYRVKNKFFRRRYTQNTPEIATLIWESPIRSENSWTKDNSFIFLNLKRSFESIDWNYSGYGKLWTYNLSYFDFLHQEGISQEQGLRLINDFIEKENLLKDALEPYPISLRGINWIKFLSNNGIQDQKISKCLFNHYHRLYANIEYHLLGNHLLENGFSLLFASVYFKDKKFKKRASKILKAELKEQILEDGAHFELSPMYHQIILYRLLDCINLLNSNYSIEHDLIDLLQSKAIQMLGWLQTITFKNGNTPMVNDSAFGIAPTSKELFKYAASLGLKWEASELKGSGYRKWTNDLYECFMDLGNVGPDYIPGHVHADTFNFELHIKEQPFIVETGTSTYEKNERRQEERGTRSHNTVLVNNTDQTEVWGGFRVGRRAKIIALEETNNAYTACHDGYKRSGTIHKRSFRCKEGEIHIEDTLLGRSVDSVASFHFHPSLKELIINAELIQCKELGVEIKFIGDSIKLEKATYEYATGFNKTKKGTLIQVSFSRNLKTIISLNELKNQEK